MLKKVIEYGLEKYAGDAEQAKAFAEGFMKEASFMGNILGAPTGHSSGGSGNPRHPETVADQLRKGVSGAIGKGVGEMAVALGATGVASVYGAVRDSNLHTKFLQALERAVNSNRILKEAPKERVLGYAETVFKFAPHVATDSNLLSSILANAIHGEGIDPMTIKTLTELEGRFTDITRFTPKTYI